MKTSIEAAGHVEQVPFGHLDIQYNRDVLRPRSWTVAQSNWAAELLQDIPPGPVLELCAGVGHIGMLVVASEAHELVLVDVNPVACELAGRNAVNAGLTDRVEIRCGRVDEVLTADERFGLIIADPPWVPSADTSGHPQDPLIAIDGGVDGLDVALTCVDVAADHLDDGGSMLLQLRNTDQAVALVDKLRGVSHQDLRAVEIRTYD